VGGTYESEGGRIDKVSKGRSEERVEGLGRLATGVDEGVEQDGLHSLDLGSSDDLQSRVSLVLELRKNGTHISESLETDVGGLSDLLVRIGEDLGESRNDSREGDGELLWCEERHGSHQLDRSLLRPPLLVVQSREERRQDQLDGVTAQLPHDGLGGVLRRLSHIRRGVSERREEDGKDFDDVGLEESSDDRREDLVSEDGTLPRLHVLLVFGVVAQLTQDPKLLETRDSSPADDTSESVRCSSTLGVLGGSEEAREELVDEGRDVGLDDPDEGRETVADGGLNDLRRRLERLDESSNDGSDARVGRVEMTGESSEEDDESLRAVILHDVSSRRASEVLLECRDQRLERLLAVDVNDDDRSLSTASVRVRE
jgi:hypothetical protein